MIALDIWCTGRRRIARDGTLIERDGATNHASHHGGQCCVHVFTRTGTLDHEHRSSVLPGWVGGANDGVRVERRDVVVGQAPSEAHCVLGGLQAVLCPSNRDRSWRRHDHCSIRRHSAASTFGHDPVECDGRNRDGMVLGDPTHCVE